MTIREKIFKIKKLIRQGNHYLISNVLINSNLHCSDNNLTATIWPDRP